MLAELDLDLSRLHFTGLMSRPDMVAVMRASDAHVYLTVPVVLSWSLLDAMACGCLLVASDTCEFLEDSVTGLLVPPHDPAALAARIETALDVAGDALRRMRERARAKIVGAFDAERVIWPFAWLEAAVSPGAPRSRPREARRAPPLTSPGRQRRRGGLPAQHPRPRGADRDRARRRRRRAPGGCGSGRGRRSSANLTRSGRGSPAPAGRRTSPSAPPAANSGLLDGWRRAERLPMKAAGMMWTNGSGLGHDSGVAWRLPREGWRGRGLPGRRSGSGGRQAPEARHVVGEGVPEEDGLDLLDAAHQQAEEAAIAGLGVERLPRSRRAACRPPWRRRCPCGGATRRSTGGSPGSAACGSRPVRRGRWRGRRSPRLSRRGRRCRRAWRSRRRPGARTAAGRRRLRARRSSGGADPCRSRWSRPRRRRPGRSRCRRRSGRCRPAASRRPPSSSPAPPDRWSKPAPPAPPARARRRARPRARPPGCRRRARPRRLGAPLPSPDRPRPRLRSRPARAARTASSVSAAASAAATRASPVRPRRGPARRARAGRRRPDRPRSRARAAPPPPPPPRGAARGWTAAGTTPPPALARTRMPSCATRSSRATPAASSAAKPSTSSRSRSTWPTRGSPPASCG